MSIVREANFLLALILCMQTACSSAASTQPRTGKDGMVLLLVRAGEFTMGSDDADADADESPAHPLYLDAFWIDQTEITNAMYARCVQAAACEAIAHPRSDRADHPDFPARGAVDTGWSVLWVG